MTHRDEKLDSLIGRRVKITWKDDCSYNEFDIGVLHYFEEFDPNIGCKTGYNLRSLETRRNCGGISFRKSHVKNIELI